VWEASVHDRKPKSQAAALCGAQQLNDRAVVGGSGGTDVTVTVWTGQDVTGGMSL
jgi:hypothetical protein